MKQMIKTEQENIDPTIRREIIKRGWEPKDKDRLWAHHRMRWAWYRWKDVLKLEGLTGGGHNERQILSNGKNSR